jgi:hypothetical protein
VRKKPFNFRVDHPAARLLGSPSMKASLGFFVCLGVVPTFLGVGDLTCAAEQSPPNAPADADSAALDLLNQFMNALLIKDENARLAAVLPCFHKSLLNNEGTDLAPTVKDYSYRRAVSEVALYQVPIRVTRVAKGNNTTVGYGQSAESGRIDRYFVAKREGVTGLPAPIHIFFPKDGSKPKVVNVGSL